MKRQYHEPDPALALFFDNSDKNIAEYFENDLQSAEEIYYTQLSKLNQIKLWEKFENQYWKVPNLFRKETAYIPKSVLNQIKIASWKEFLVDQYHNLVLEDILYYQRKFRKDRS